jgi:hypothetical protein
MRSRQELFQDLPEPFHQQAQDLTTLFKCVSNQRRADSGLVAGEHTYLIYWPAIFNDFNGATRRLASAVRCPKPPEPTRTYRRFLRQHVEDLLGPLQLPVGEAHFDYANTQCQGAARSKDNEVYRAMCDAENYTAFQRLDASFGAALRTRVVPPPKGLLAPWMNELPDAVVLLYEAWLRLAKRSAIDLFSGRESGLCFLRDGRLFIQWEVFLNFHDAGLRGKGTTPLEICKQLAQLKRPFSLVSSLLRRDVRPKDGYAVEEVIRYPRAMNSYQKALYSTGLCDTVPLLKSYCTIIDPVVLHRKPQLFDGRAYWRRRHRVEESRRAHVVRRSRGEAPLRVARLHTFEFRPKLYLTQPDEVTRQLGDHQWFDDNHKETAYAIKRKGVFYFARPLYLSTKNQACANDVELWVRALESLKMVMKYDEDGDLGDVYRDKKSAYIKSVPDELRQRAGAAFIVDFKKREHRLKSNGQPDISEREWQRAMQRFTAQEFKQNPGLLESTTRAGNWYNKIMAQISREIIPESDIRREAYVQPPNKKKPETVQFYSPLALDTFDLFANASFGLIDLAYHQTPLMALLTGGRVTAPLPAPYILAWTRFCIDVQKRHGELPGTTDNRGAAWSPSEDLVMLLNYTTAPRMSKEAWKKMLVQLPDRTQSICRTHASNCNSLLKQVLSPQRMETHRFGRRPCTIAEAMRTILVMGCARAAARRGETLNRSASFVKRIFDVPDATWERSEVPARYHGPEFQPWLDYVT